MVGFREDSIHAFEQSLGDAAGPGEPSRGCNRQDLIGENPLSNLGTLVAFAFIGTDFGINLKIRYADDVGFYAALFQNIH
jgi:hypothetical protein